jgi:thermitase
MKNHIILKLREPLVDGKAIPFWVDFINDKSTIRETVNPDVDRLMRQLGLSFWLTKEFKPEGPEPNAAEIAEGLNRTYRMILQKDYGMPADLAERIKLIPSVEDARRTPGLSRWERRRSPSPSWPRRLPSRNGPRRN